MSKVFLVLGGDNRLIYLANVLFSEGYDVKVYGIESSLVNSQIYKCASLDKALENTDVIVGPLPLSQDDETLNCSYFEEVVYLKDIFKEMNKNQMFFAGFVSNSVHQLAGVYNIHIYDYFQREELVVQNCIPTAEGAIQIALQELPFTLHDSNCLILGFGRIGKILSKMLHGIGAKVWIEARKYHDLAWVKSFGYEGIHLNDLEEHLSKFDIIFNTIPSLILNQKMLTKLKSDCLVIDLASKPGGVDFDYAKQTPIKVIWALSLPGKVAPLTSANIIKSTIFNIMEELGV